MAVDGPRGVKREELEGLVDLADRVFRPDGPGSMADDYPLLFTAQNLENLRVFCDDGRPVAHVGTLFREVVLGDSRHLACLIGSVCCDPEYRERGLATQLLEDARARAGETGADLFLISGGRGLYRRLGYVDAGHYPSFTVQRDQVPDAGSYSIRPFETGDLPAVNAIHARESVRFVRTLEDLTAVFGTGKVANRRGAFLAVCAADSDEPVAYIACQYGAPHWENRPPNAVTIAEVGGTRWAIASVLGQLMDDRGVGELVWRCLASDAEAPALARSFGWSHDTRGFPGTLGIIAPELFWDRCRNRFRELLGAAGDDLCLACEGEATVISLGDERVVLADMGALTRLVFLPASQRADLDLGLSDDSPLGAALDRVLPLPLVDYGLNYA